MSPSPDMIEQATGFIGVAIVLLILLSIVDYL